MDKTKEEQKKCICPRCLQPIALKDKVDIDGQSFHRACGTCCVCGTIPKSLKMFNGHVFCPDCFQSYILDRLKCENSAFPNDWWIQWAAKVKSQSKGKDDSTEKSNAKDDNTNAKDDNTKSKPEDNNPAPCICACCRKPCDEKCKVEIGGQSFHPGCAVCCSCQCVPKGNVKIFFGQVFCEECFNRYVAGKNKCHQNEFFKACFEHLQKSPQTAECFFNLMSSSENKPPIVLINSTASFGCHLNQEHKDWSHSFEPTKCAL